MFQAIQEFTAKFTYSKVTLILSGGRKSGESANRPTLKNPVLTPYGGKPQFVPDRRKDPIRFVILDLHAKDMIRDGYKRPHVEFTQLRRGTILRREVRHHEKTDLLRAAFGCDGNLYGVTPHGGNSSYGGTFFKMKPSGVRTTLYYLFLYGRRLPRRQHSGFAHSGTV